MFSTTVASTAHTRTWDGLASSYAARDSAFGTAASAMKAALPGQTGGERFRRHTSSASGTNANNVT